MACSDDAHQELLTLEENIDLVIEQIKSGLSLNSCNCLFNRHVMTVYCETPNKC